MIQCKWIFNNKKLKELNFYNILQKTVEENTKKQQKKILKNFKKEDKKKAHKETKEELKEIELVLELVKIDGYIFRTIEKEENLGNNEKVVEKGQKGEKKMI